MKLAFPVLVGDIGGTNARFSMIGDTDSAPTPFDAVRVDALESIEDAIQFSVLDRTSIRPASMMLAIATPLIGEAFRLTNADWVIDPRRIIGRFGLASLVLFNDFTAQGLAALALKEENLNYIGEARPIVGEPKVVIGPGTGLGIAILVKVGGRWAIIPGEGGHVDLGPRTPREFAIWPNLDMVNGRMGAEMAVSGRGLVNLYLGICRLEGKPPETRAAETISRNGMSGNDPLAREAIELFLTLLARITGDMALIVLSRGGIYIAGGIAAKLMSAIDPQRFRAEFANKAPHESILSEIAVSVMTHPTAALEGLCACAQYPDQFSLEGSARVFGGE